MKFLTLSLLMIFSLTSFAQHESMGGVAGGGMPGFQYLQCTGEIYVSNTKIEEVAITVQVTRNGMMTRITKINNNKVLVSEVTERKVDHFGITYVGKKAVLEIPQIPSPTWGQGEVNVIVKIKGIRQSTISCSAFSPN